VTTTTTPSNAVGSKNAARFSVRRQGDTGAAAGSDFSSPHTSFGPSRSEIAAAKRRTFMTMKQIEQMPSNPYFAGQDLR
jgi:hypothetical protein